MRHKYFKKGCIIAIASPDFSLIRTKCNDFILYIEAEVTEEYIRGVCQGIVTGKS